VFLSPPFAPCSCRLLHLDGGAWAISLIAGVTFTPKKEVILAIFENHKKLFRKCRKYNQKAHNNFL
jgi:hypothetical protein